jgi:hypothetical protein
VVLDGARADEQARADLRVGQAVDGQSGHLGLLGGQRLADLAGDPITPVAGVGGSLPSCLAGGVSMAKLWSPVVAS